MFVRKVQSRCLTRQGDDFGFRRENVNGIRKKVNLDMFEKLGGVAGLLLDVQKGLKPSKTVFLKVGQCFVFGLVQPVSGHARFRNVMHFSVRI